VPFLSPSKVMKTPRGVFNRLGCWVVSEPALKTAGSANDRTIAGFMILDLESQELVNGAQRFFVVGGSLRAASPGGPSEADP